MRIVRKKVGHTVIAMTENNAELILEADRLSGEVNVLGIIGDDYEILEDVAEPQLWIEGGNMTYDGTWAFAGDTSALDDNLDTFQAVIKDKVRGIATEKREGGYSVNGLRLGTDSTAMALLTGGALLEAPSYKVVTSKGKAVLPGATFQFIYSKVAGYVQEVFDHSYDLHSDIDAVESVTELLTMDLDSGWPEPSYTSPEE